jgi:hypothetical protein
MGISVRDGKYLNGARKVLHAYFAFVDLYSSASTPLEIGTISYDELSLTSNANIYLSNSSQNGLYYIDLYIPFNASAAFNGGDNFDIAWYNNSSFSYPDIEDLGFGYNFIVSYNGAYARHCIITELTSSIYYTVIIRNNNISDYNTSDGVIRMYKL